MEGSLAEIIAEFNRQRAANPATADRSLLQAGRKLLEEHLQRSRWELQVVHPGHSLLWRLGDYPAVADLLSRYLTQPLSVDEEAWARWHLVDGLALCGRCEETVRRQRDFLQWAQATFPQQPPSLSRDIPFEPISEHGGPALSEDSLLLWVMGDGTQAGCWVEIGKGEEWLRIFHDLMGAVPATPENRFRRFNYLRTASLIAARLRRGDEALRIAERIGALAEEAASPEEALGWKMEASVAEIRVHQEGQNTEALRRAGSMAAALVEEYEREQSAMNAPDQKRLRSFCHNTAASLYRAGAYGLAIPLLRRAIEYGTPYPWPYLWLAASLWATTKDRTEVLPLLEQASYRYRGDNVWEECRNLPEFADAAGDQQFQEAAAIASTRNPATND